MNNSVGSFSILVPVYNEEAIVIAAIEQNIAVLTAAGVFYEIIVINDGSTDNTDFLLKNNFTDKEFVKIIHHSTNNGFGGAAKTGILHTKNNYIICVPADSPLTDEVFAAFIGAINKADIVVSYRIARLGYTPRMRFNSLVYHLLIEILFDIHFADFNWIHLYHRRIFDEGKIEITSKGIFMLAEILIKASWKGYSFYEIPVAQTERLTGIASASKFSVALKTLKEVILFKVQDKSGSNLPIKSED